MAVKGSGALSITTDIVGEFGGVAPHSLSEYYGGGTYVPAGANPGISTSGAINFGSHYGAVAATVLTVSSNVNNYDIGAAAIAAGGDKSTPVILTINAGVTVGSTSTSNPAMYTGTGWSAGTTINITNNGSIVGSSGTNTVGWSSGNGGNAGRGGQATSYNNRHGVSGQAGSNGTGSAESANNGGNAFEHSQTADNNLSVIFDTVGTRTGGSNGAKTLYAGGGGGGGGGGGYFESCYQSWYLGGGGGGGGRGTGTPAGGYRGYGNGASGQSGQRGYTSAAGNKGNGGNNQSSGGHGGQGGTIATSGQQGQAGWKRGGWPHQPADYQYSNLGSGGAGGSNGSAQGSAGSATSGNTSQIS